MMERRSEIENMLINRSILTEVIAVVAVLGSGFVAFDSAAVAAQAETVAQDPNSVKIESIVKVVRKQTKADGKTVTTLVAPKDTKVVPGDELIFINSYVNSGRAPVADFVVDNPVPSAVSVTEIGENWAQVSVDGGNVYGRLQDLTVTEDAPVAEGSTAAPTKIERPAKYSDVTHIKWKFPSAIVPNGTGNLQFHAVVK